MKHIMSESSRSELTAVQEGDTQPNAVDLRLGKVFAIKPHLFEISNEHKTHRGSVEIDPDSEGYYFLRPGQYEIVMENIIKVASFEAGWVFTRSTLIRNGLFITTGLYDSGYHGAMGAVLNVGTGPARIKQGTRIGQYINFTAEMLHKYDGDYGIGKAHDKKYDIH